MDNVERARGLLNDRIRSIAAEKKACEQALTALTSKPRRKTVKKATPRKRTKKS